MSAEGDPFAQLREDVEAVTVALWQSPTFRRIVKNIRSAAKHLGQDLLSESQKPYVNDSSDHNIDLVELANRLAWHLRAHGFYNAFTESGRIYVNPDDTLVFDQDKPQLDLELRRLSRILVNAAANASEVANYLESTEGRGHKFNSALRKALTIRDSLSQMSDLVVGIDLDEKTYGKPIDLFNN